MAPRVDARILFDALTLEGGLLPPEWLTKVAALEAPLQQPSDYGVPKGLELRDEITRYWRMAEALYVDFAKQREPAKDGGERATDRFVSTLLAQVFGFSGLAAGGQREVQGRGFTIDYEYSDGRVPVVLSAAGDGLDTPTARHGDGGRRRSAWGSLQEYLNASDDSLWGIASNGLRLRIGRDNTSLTRPAWIEADLERIFDEDRFADFSVLWLIVHATRFAGEPTECPLERWRDAAREAGTRARDQLRDGVEAALLALGQGFICEPSNTPLRQALAVGDITPAEYFNELLRLVYRMIFLVTVEERGILHDDNVAPETRALYAEGYAMRRLVDRSIRRSQRDRHHDKWAALRPVFAALGRAGGEARLGLPELGGLFAPAQCAHLDSSDLGNRALLEAVFRLGWLRQSSGLSRVNWKDMGPEELGSIYESLLELVPRISDDGRSFTFAGSGESAGNERKLTGSYYTPDSLVQQLLDTALEPVIDARLAADDDAERALLSITVIDPACGSGHFLLAAARRLASRLAAVRTGGTPGAHEYRIALRDVVTHCIHGVDRNPMALELARMSLWLETYTPDRALGFLDHHLAQGDALLGLLDLSVLKAGIPDEAFKALTGDDKGVARTLSKLNKVGLKQLEKRRRGEELELALRQPELGDAFAHLDDLGDDRLETVEAKRERYEALRARAAESAAALAADLFLGAFLIPKRLAPGEKALTESAAAGRFPTTGTLLMALDDGLNPDHTVAVAARHACRAASVLHWPLAFPQVFARGGFDVVLGNPPWDMLQTDAQEFFAATDPEIASAPNLAKRTALIEGRLKRENPALYEAFRAEESRVHRVQAFVHGSGRFPHSAFGRINLAPLFAEMADQLRSESGRGGLVLPTGIATDSFTQHLFRHFAEGRLVSLYDFENRQALFPAVDSRQKFCLFTIGQSRVAEFAFFLEQVHELSDERRRFELAPDEFRLINPNTLNCPIFRSRADAELTKKIYRNVPVLIDETKGPDEGNPWGLSFKLMFMMNTDSHLFHDRPDDDRLPLYEGKMIHQFDHRWATYDVNANGSVGSRDVTDAEKQDPAFEVRSRYWVDRTEVSRRAARVPPTLPAALKLRDGRACTTAVAEWFGGYFLNRGDEERGNRLIRSWLGESLHSAHERWLGAQAAEKAYPLTEEDLELVQRCSSGREMAEALVAAKTPAWFVGWRDICRATDERTVIASVLPEAGVGNKVPLMLTRVSPELHACLLANFNALCQDYAARQKIGGITLNFFILKQLPICSPDVFSEDDVAFIVPRVAELTYTSDGMRPWARSLGITGEPFEWLPERRAQVRAELDVYFARLYGLDREDLEYILDPASSMEADYPSETFRVLKSNDERAYGEYRTRRLVLEAWDAMEAGRLPASQRALMLQAVQMPLPIKPALNAVESAALSVLAFVTAAEGSISPTVLVRAYGLRSHQSYALRHAPPHLRSAAAAWADPASSEAAPPLIPLLQRLVDGGRLRWQRKGDSERIVATAATPRKEQLSPWSLHEAYLLLSIEDGLQESQTAVLDATLPAEDRVLLSAMQA